MAKEKTKGVLTALIFFALFVIFFWNLGLPHLTNWDEAWNADIARNMLKTGNILTPIWNTQSFFDKPPLYFWLSALSFKIFGVSEFSARFFSALSGFGVGVLVYFLCRSLFNKDVAILSLVILGSTIGFLFRAHTGNLDVLLAFFIMLSIFSFFKGLISKNKMWFMVFGISVGLGFLTKGTIAFLFPIMAVFYPLLKSEYNTLKVQFLPVSIVIGLVISLTWFIISYFANGQEFIANFLLNQTEKWVPSLYFWKSFSLEYISFLKNGLKFWFLLFIPSLFFVGYYWQKTKSQLLLVFFVLLFVALSFSENKSNWFLVPLYPVISIITAFGIYQITKKFLGQKFIMPVALLIILIAAFQNFLYRNEYIVPDIAGDEARVALAAKNFTEKDDILYLTNYYYPTTVYYSERKVYAVYSEQERNLPWWIKQQTDWGKILEINRVFIITTKEELESLKEYFSKYKFELLYQSGEKILLKKV